MGAKMNTCKECNRVLPEFEQEHGVNICWFCDNIDSIYPITRTSIESYGGSWLLCDWEGCRDNRDTYEANRPCDDAFLRSVEYIEGYDLNLFFIHVSDMARFFDELGEAFIVRPIDDYILTNDIPELKRHKLYIEIYDAHTE